MPSPARRELSPVLALPVRRRDCVSGRARPTQIANPEHGKHLPGPVCDHCQHESCGALRLSVMPLWITPRCPYCHAKGIHQNPDTGELYCARPSCRDEEGRCHVVSTRSATSAPSSSETRPHDHPHQRPGRRRRGRHRDRGPRSGEDAAGVPYVSRPARPAASPAGAARPTHHRSMGPRASARPRQHPHQGGLTRHEHHRASSPLSGRPGLSRSRT